jgi:uncharacterized protein (DUF342 family)
MERDKFDRLEDKIDKITERLDDLNSTLSENTASLIIHEKRTDLAEKKLELVESKIIKQAEKDQLILDKIDERLQPLQKTSQQLQDHVNFVNKIFLYVIPSLSALFLFLLQIGIIKL